MLIKRAPMFKASEITDYRLYLNRREFIAGGGRPGPRAPSVASAGPRHRRRAAASGDEEREVQPSPRSRRRSRTRRRTTTSTSSAWTRRTRLKYAHMLKPRPWTVQVDGLVHKPKNVRHRGDPQVSPGGANLLAPLRRGLVHGDSLDRFPTGPPPQAGASRRARPSSWSSRRSRTRSNSRGRSRTSSVSRRSSGRTWRASGWTRRCTR